MHSRRGMTLGRQEGLQCVEKTSPVEGKSLLGVVGNEIGKLCLDQIVESLDF